MKLKELMDLFENTIFRCHKPLITWGYTVKTCDQVNLRLNEDEWANSGTIRIKVNNEEYEYYDDMHKDSNLKLKEDLLEKEVKSIKTIGLCPKEDEISSYNHGSSIIHIIVK